MYPRAYPNIPWECVLNCTSQKLFVIYRIIIYELYHGLQSPQDGAKGCEILTSKGLKYIRTTRDGTLLMKRGENSQPTHSNQYFVLRICGQNVGRWLTRASAKSKVDHTMYRIIAETFQRFFQEAKEIYASCSTAINYNDLVLVGW